MNAQHKLVFQTIQELGPLIHGAQAIILRKVGLSRQAFNQWLHREETPWEQQETLLKQKVLLHFNKHRQRIAAGKLKIYLDHDTELNFYVSPKRVKRLMTLLHLKCQSRVKKHHHVKQAEQELRDNVLNQRFNMTTKPNEVWLSDATEVHYGINGEYKARLCGVLDLHGRYLLSYNLSVTETSDAMIETFKRAFNKAGEAHPICPYGPWLGIHFQGL